MKFNAAVISVISVFLFSPGWPAAADNTGTTAAVFLKLPNGAQPSALGNSFTAGQGGVSLFWNPASLFYLNQVEINLNTAFWFEDIKLGSAAISFPVWEKGVQERNIHRRRLSSLKEEKIGQSKKKLGVFSLGLIYLDPGKQAITDLSQQGEGITTSKTVSANDLALYFSFSRQWHSLGWGSSLKIIRSTLAEFTATAVALDLGVYCPLKKFNSNPKRKLIGGVVLQNIGTNLDFRKDTSNKDSLPFQVKTGVKYVINDFNYLVDLSKSIDNKFKLNFGLEYQLPEVGYFRFGYKIIDPDLKYWGKFIDAFSLGLGLPVSFIGAELDYAYSSYGDLGMVHHFSLVFRR